MADRIEEPAPELVEGSPPPDGEGRTSEADPSSKSLSSDDHRGNLDGVSWFSQFYWCLWKNCLLLSRRPIMLSLVLLSSVISMVMSWGAGGRDPEDAIYPPADAFTDCGNIRQEFIDDIGWEQEHKIQSLNENWRDGLEVALMGLGPFFNALFAFTLLNTEFSAQLVGVLRALGLRDSVYWLSWYTPFANIAVVNSLLGAITAKVLTGHVYENVFFGGIFASLFFLNLSLISASFFLVAVCGASRKLCSNFTILIMLVAAFTPLIVGLARSDYYWYSYDSSFSSGSSGLFWQYKNTEVYERRGWSTYFFDDQFNFTEQGDVTFVFRGEDNSTTGEYCHYPVVSEYQGNWFKTEEEQATVGADEIFTGCYVRASWPFSVWQGESRVERLLMFFFPYFHFSTMWSSFVGYTDMPNRKFTSAQATMSQDKLAMDSLPAPPNPDGGGNSSLAEQGSMFITRMSYNYDYSYPSRYSCPISPHPDFNFCEYLYDCGYAADPAGREGSPSVVDSIGYFIALSIMYLLLAGYWATVFSRSNGNSARVYFFLQPSYWFGQKTKQRSDTDETAEGVTIDGVRKSYGDFEALKGVSFKMRAGEVTALLGHNGAGKTTLSSIICCETPASDDGDIRVFGHSVSQDPFAVRQMVGLCKQDDYLWPNLSAREHLELFAGLRGVDSHSLGATVQKWLQSVDLDGVQGQYSSAYSGGMKRRLSLALATIGGRPLIVLDEPTTGMDPVSRRFVWRHIDEIKEGRVILLTTHAMEEADLLADEVAIMRKGELAAFGSPLQLKTEHGTALQFSLLAEEGRLVDAQKYIDDYFSDSREWVTTEFSNAGTVLLKISSLKEASDSEGIEIQKLTDFVGWLNDKESPISEYGFSNSSLEEVFLKVTEGDVASEETTTAHSAENDTVAPSDEEEFGMEASPNDMLGISKGSLSSRNQAIVIWRFFLQRGWSGRNSIGNYTIFGLFLLGTVLLMVGVSSNAYPLPALTLVIFFMSIILIAIVGPIYADRFEGQFYLMKSQGLLPLGYITGICLYAFTIQLVYNTLTMIGVFASSFFREIVKCEETNSGTDDDWWFGGECYSWGFGSKEEAFPSLIRNFEDEYNGETVTLSALRAPGGFGMALAVALVATIPAVGYSLTTAFFPGYRFPLVIIMTCTMVASALPILPVYLYRSDDHYYECSNTTNPGFVCSNTTFTRESIDSQFMDCVGFDINSQTIQSYCVTPAASLLSHFGIFQMLSMAYTSKVTFFSEPEGYVQEVLIPALDADVRCKDDTCSFPFANRLFGLNLMFTIIGGILFILLGLFMAFTLGFPVGPFQRLRQSFTRFSPRFRPLQHTESMKRDGGQDAELPEVGDEREVVQDKVKPLLVDDNLSDPKLNHTSLQREGLDPVLTHKLRKVYPALGGRPPMVALDSLDLHVPKGQVLGLLGKNGAGKTTALKILAGAHESSGGIGLVSGYDCDVERISVFERLGNCAQFDVVWSKMSVQRHLEFFAALKGLPKAEIETAARAVAKAVGLGSDEVYARNAGALSGGMRRRLSIGMALIGAPSVVILDEPTTGLDPSTRSSIWSLINSFASKERSMIITTHMMIEADTLCNRIAIVAHGKLVVIGTQQHLKNKFGDGYVLQLNLVHSSPEYQERAMKFVRDHLHPEARLGTRQAKTLHVNLPRDIDLERVFRALYSEKRTSEGGINQFLLSQSSLEDVFIALGD